MEPLLVILGALLTAADGSGPVVETVEVGRDVVLPCSPSPKEDLEFQHFEWEKDRGKKVYKYESGITYGSGSTDQDEHFRDRVSHFHNDLKNGNASIKISKTKVSDSGTYTCDFPRLQPRQMFSIQLVVGGDLKDRSEERIPGAASKPILKTLSQTDNEALLQCEVYRASPKPVVQLKDSSGNILPAEEVKGGGGGSQDIILQTTVTKSDTYSCVATQEDRRHEIKAGTYVFISGTDLDPPAIVSGPSVGLIVGFIVGLIVVGILGFVLGAWVYPHYQKWLPKRGTEDIRNAEGGVNGAKMEPLLVKGADPVTVKEGEDAVLRCSPGSNENLESKLFEWRKDGGKGVFMYAGGCYTHGLSKDKQFEGRVSFLPEELKNGIAAIKISQTRLSDSGTYTCEFPPLQPKQTISVQLDVDKVTV